MSYEHVPVLLDACIEALAIRPDGTYVDGTVGGGGHAFEIAKRLSSGKLIGIDRDLRAIDRARRRLEPFADRVTLVHGNFRDLGEILDKLDVGLADGMLFDLGASSPQFDETERGFSYRREAPLDMRMDESETLTAYEIVNAWPQEELRRILREYGEERYAGTIAAAIARRRASHPIETTTQLAELIKSAMPSAALREKQHPAKRSFQAIRIAVNGELEALSAVLDTAADRLRPGGRLAVISFHSLEDRLVKEAFAARERGCTCPRDFPVCVCGFQQTLKVITRKPITAAESETADNPRARSAKLRVAQRV